MSETKHTHKYSRELLDRLKHVDGRLSDNDCLRILDCIGTAQLLQALKECLRTRWSGERHRTSDPLLDKVKAAIAKAEGQQ